MNRVMQSRFVINLKRNIEDNPLVAIGVAVGVVTVVAKLIDAVGHARGSSAYARQVNAKIKKSQ